MSTVYSLSTRERWHLHSDVRLSDHITMPPDDRWDDRTPPDYPSPEHALERAVDVSTVSNHLGSDADEARYFWTEIDEGGFGVVFLICVHDNGDRVATTVKPTHWLNHGPTRAYLAAHNHEFEP